MCCCEVGVWIWDWSTLEGFARFGVGGVTGMELLASVVIGLVVSATLMGLVGSRYASVAMSSKMLQTYISHLLSTDL